MAKFLSSKAKVVRNLSVSVVCLFLFHPAISQHAIPVSDSPAISLHCKACTFADLLLQLEAKTNLYFIYSSDIVQVSEPIAVALSDRSIDEVLDFLASHFKLTFKRTGQHVVIRNVIPDTSVREVKVEKETHTPRSDITASPESRVSAPGLDIGHRNAVVEITDDSSDKTAPAWKEIVIKKPDIVFAQYFDAKRLTLLPERYVKALNLRNNHPGWYASAGLLVNDYSVGVDLQAGLRAVHLVFRPAWRNDGSYHSAYGLGTSMLLKRNFAFNTVYTFALIKQVPEFSNERLDHLSQGRMILLSRHHRLSFILQYSLTKNIALRGGLSINHLSTTPDLTNGTFHVGLSQAASDATPVRGMYGPVSFQRVIIRRSPSDALHTTRMWMGWEASLSYKINFYPRFSRIKVRANN